jgi:hypothetical protein
VLTRRMDKRKYRRGRRGEEISKKDKSKGSSGLCGENRIRGA